MTNIEWNKIVETPLDFALARLKAPKVTDLNAADQIITALHESVHIVYAIAHGYGVISIQVATSPKGITTPCGNNAKGHTLDTATIGTIADIENYTAAALFEYSLDSREDNFVASSEEGLALKSIRYFNSENKYELSKLFTSDIGLLDSTLEKIYPSDIENKWPVIQTVAKAILIHRDKKSGIVPNFGKQQIVSSINKYVRDYFDGKLSDCHYFGRFDSTISWLSPYARTINQRDELTHAKWMRENDIDTILENHKRKYLRG